MFLHSQPERAASLLHNISENCTSLVWMTNAHSLVHYLLWSSTQFLSLQFEQLIYGALKLHERFVRRNYCYEMCVLVTFSSSSLAVCGISVLSANFVTTLSSYLSSSGQMHLKELVTCTSCDPLYSLPIGVECRIASSTLQTEPAVLREQGNSCSSWYCIC